MKLYLCALDYKKDGLAFIRFARSKGGAIEWKKEMTRLAGHGSDAIGNPVTYRVFEVEAREVR